MEKKKEARTVFFLKILINYAINLSKKKIKNLDFLSSSLYFSLTPINFKIKYNISVTLVFSIRKSVQGKFSHKENVWPIDPSKQKHLVIDNVLSKIEKCNFQRSTKKT